MLLMKQIEFSVTKLGTSTNDKSTGSVVGQQPFGGSGKSGTHDKAGDINLLFLDYLIREI